MEWARRLTPLQTHMPTRLDGNAGWSCAIVKIDGDLTLEREAQLKKLCADIYRHLPIVHSVAVRMPTHAIPRTLLRPAGRCLLCVP